MESERVVDARQERIDADKAWQLLESGTSVTVAKGKKVFRFRDVASEKDEILENVMGPSGNLRAPTFRVGNDFLVGFNAELYEEWFR